ncbi:MAG: DUF11 domain-containing protein [Candidatus Sumerlaeaceae bacterium]|nr:DUF11 domain-containing protein [Candidatus Sumerlaeaceae bacterium]
MTSEPLVELGTPSLATDTHGTWIMSYGHSLFGSTLHSDLRAMRSYDNGYHWTMPETAYSGMVLQPPVFLKYQGELAVSETSGTWMHATSSQLFDSDETVWFTTTSVPLRDRADLEVTLVPQSASTELGDIITFTAHASNHGSGPAIGANALVSFPAELNFDSTTATGAIYDPTNRELLVPLGDLAVTSSSGFQFSATAAALTSATILSVGVDSETTDPELANNSAYSIIVIGRRSVDLRITLDPTSASVLPGDLVPAILTVSNLGPKTATQPTVVVTFPPEIDFNSTTANGAAFVPATRQLTVTLGDIAASSSGGFGFAGVATGLTPECFVGANVNVDPANNEETNPPDNTTSMAVTIGVGPADMAVRWRSGGLPPQLPWVATAGRSGRLWTITTPVLRVFNRGPLVSKACKVSYFLSADNVYDRRDVLLRKDPVPAMAPGQSVLQPQPFQTGNRIIGKKYVIAIIDLERINVDTMPANNSAAIPLQIQ